jgi:hypothetical protein
MNKRSRITNSNLYGTQTTPGGIEKLKESLPTLEVVVFKNF